MTNYQFRNAKLEDTPLIAALHAENWRKEYQGILPDEYLQTQVCEERLAHWSILLSPDGPSPIVVVAFDDAELAGFAAIIRNQDKAADATLDNLHVARRARKKGLGRTLMARAVAQHMDAGGKSLCLWVFDDNQAAFRLYERLGGEKTETGFDTMHGANAAHTQFTWYNLSELLAKCRDR
ncbi:MAG: GNAT family N-acetyltransferase [Hyphomicrobiales bacterium]